MPTTATEYAASADAYIDRARGYYTDPAAQVPDPDALTEGDTIRAEYVMSEVEEWATSAGQCAEAGDAAAVVAAEHRHARRAYAALRFAAIFPPAPRRPAPTGRRWSDTDALDYLAEYLAQPVWSGTETLEAIADVIGRTDRPHPGDYPTVDRYAHDFHAATGRALPETE